MVVLALGQHAVERVRLRVNRDELTKTEQDNSKRSRLVGRKLKVERTHIERLKVLPFGGVQLS